jgi:acyl carrier protein
MPIIGSIFISYHRYNPVSKVDELQDDVDEDNSTLKLDLLIKGEENQTVYEVLKRIWIELLGEDKIQSDDDFNSLGGESLLAIQMINLVKKRIGFQLEIADTFGYPTLGALAVFITDELHKDENEDKILCKVSSKFDW